MATCPTKKLAHHKHYCMKAGQQVKVRDHREYELGHKIFTTEQMYYRQRKEYGGMDTEQLKRLGGTYTPSQPQRECGSLPCYL